MSVRPRAVALLTASVALVVPSLVVGAEARTLPAGSSATAACDAAVAEAEAFRTSGVIAEIRSNRVESIARYEAQAEQLTSELAEAEADLDEATATRDLAQTALADAESALAEAQSSGTPEDIAAAQEQLDTTTSLLADAERAVSDADADVLARTQGLDAVTGIILVELRDGLLLSTELLDGGPVTPATYDVAELEDLIGRVDYVVSEDYALLLEDVLVECFGEAYDGVPGTPVARPAAPVARPADFTG
ncbi:hypothetical protein [Aquipuribacter nitratireducens]|uniref:TolA protein n=1 Tax=Aquipuribacter nitratireducens TaxID=650104 RepID=A0ABW0GP37_9MICO